MRQRKALSRTSSNILLNSVHMAHTTHQMHHSHHMNYLHPSDCDLNLTLKQLRRDSTYSSTSNIEVIIFSISYHTIGAGVVSSKVRIQKKNIKKLTMVENSSKSEMFFLFINRKKKTDSLWLIYRLVKLIYTPSNVIRLCATMKAISPFVFE